jgi:TolB-like protein/class 3 adenylate cyclase
MTTQGVTRNLKAILSADVEGYSRLMSQDEVGTIRTLKSYKEAISVLIKQYRGRVVDAPGDNLLAEFGSVSDAVNCAAEIQRELAERNAELPDSRKLEFRIGINLGDVVEEEGRIYGDGVNISARVEGLAEGGGICISGTVYDQVKNKVGLEYEYLGEQTVKNITEPVRVYRVLSFPGAAAYRVVKAKEALGRKWRKAALAIAAILFVGAAVVVWNFFLRPAPPLTEVASEEQMAFPLPDKPSIAVLPFVNMSDDPNQEYFSDGITEDLITDLSAISGLFVIARNSTYVYKGKPIKIKQVAEELGVKYVLEGSVRKADNQVRINAQLIDAITGHHLWAKRYDGHMGDVFALQDKITKKIVSALRVKLTGVEQKKVARKETDNIAAYDAFLKGWGHYLRQTPDDFVKAISYFEKSIELDPNYGRAYAAVALTYWRRANAVLYAFPGVNYIETVLRAREYLQLAMKNPPSISHRLRAIMALNRRQYEEAVSEAEHAIELDPNDSDGLYTMALVMMAVGKPEEAVESIQRGMRLDPLNTARPLYLLGMVHFCMGQFEEAANLIERALAHNPKLQRHAPILSAAYAHLGRDQKARAALNDYQKAFWGINLQVIMNAFPFKDLEVSNRLADGLLKAGVPGEPSGYYKFLQKYRLSGEKIRELVFGRKITGFKWYYGTQYWIDRTKDGKSTYRVPPHTHYDNDDSGTSWIEDDMLCNQWQIHTAGIKHCMTVFRNPEGTPEMKNEYLTVSDFGIRSFSPAD